MKAILHTKYGPPGELQLKGVEKSVPKNNEVLIKIHATTVTTTDCNARNFTFVPKSFRFPARMYFGFRKPKINMLGVDFVPGMVSFGQEKVSGEQLQDRVNLQVGDGTDIKHGDNSFDVSAIAFDIRNIPDKEKALSEIMCVVVPNGQVIVLGLTTPEPDFWRSTYSLYLMGLLAEAGATVYQQLNRIYLSCGFNYELSHTKGIFGIDDSCGVERREGYSPDIWDVHLVYRG